VSGPRSYPGGVTSWVDLESPDLNDAKTLYGGLFGWSFVDAAGPASRYAVAQLGGQDVAGIGSPADGRAAWFTYIAVDDADTAATRIDAAGGHIVAGPTEIGAEGRFALCADPAGVQFRLWQAGERAGAQLVNQPGGWNFSDLHAADPPASAAFYSQVFGWSFDDLGFATMIRQPGYGDHLQATSDPDIYTRQGDFEAPPGFADAIGWLAPAGEDEEPHWHVCFTVADRDATVSAAERLGCTVLSSTDSDWTRDAVIRDPHGAVFTASQFTPPTG
jgi:predicted enzyme related to lactoylglutathione lyase